MPKRPRRKKSSRPPPAGRTRQTRADKSRPGPSTLPLRGDAQGEQGARQLLYKVVELSTVDEHHLERTLNEWVPRGWTLSGVQFAMRESSKRPSMAFVFFTREGVVKAEAPFEAGVGEGDDSDSDSDAACARERLHRLAGGLPPMGGMLAPVPSAAQPDPEHRTDDVRELHPYREFDPADLERNSHGDLDERTWPDRPERATDPWARLQALASEEEDDEGSDL